MTFQDDLALDYGTVISLLTLRFGMQFELSSTGGGCYALTATLETGDLVMITDISGPTLERLDARNTGFGVGIYAETEEGNEQMVYIARELSRDQDDLGLGDLVQTAMACRATFGTYIEGPE